MSNEKDFSKQDLRGKNFDNADLREVNLKKDNLVNVSLVGVNLSGADLSNAILMEKVSKTQAKFQIVDPMYRIEHVKGIEGVSDAFVVFGRFLVVEADPRHADEVLKEVHEFLIEYYSDTDSE